MYSDSGIVATGRGGAWVAGADTQFAQRYNPAGLVKIEAPSVNLGWSGIQQNITFERMKPDGTFYKPEVNGAPPFSIPQVGFATPIGDKFGFAFGFYSPFAPSSDYKEEGEQRYSVKETTILQFSVGPSLAWRPVPQFAIGVGVNMQVLHVAESLDITWSGYDSPDGDIGIDLRITDAVNPNFNAGILIEPIKEISIGVCFEPHYRYEAKGRAKVDFTGNAVEDMMNKTKYTDDDIVATIKLPLILRTGVAVRPVPKLEIEAALIWQRWSKMTDIPIQQVDFELDLVEDSLLDLLLAPEDQIIDQDFEIPQNFVDTRSYRLGAEYSFADELDWRIGGFFENGSLKGKFMDVSLVDPAKWQFGTGPSVFLLDRKLRLDGSFAMIFFPKVEVRNSTRIQTDAGVIPVTPVVVGNGDYSSNGWVTGFQASWIFRKKKPSIKLGGPEAEEG